MRIFWAAAGFALALSAGAAQAGEAGDQLAQSLYDGTIGDLATRSAAACEAGEGDACFALGLDGLISAYEILAEGLYRHGVVTPNSPALAMVLGVSLDEIMAPLNPNPEPLTYEQFRDLLDSFSKSLDIAAGHMQQAGEARPSSSISIR